MLQYSSRIWYFGLCQCIGSHGNSGGLALFWDPRKIVPLWWISNHSSISMVASALDSGETILISNVYAPLDIRCKTQLWAHLQFVRSCPPYLPWILGGDFNYVLSLEEKRGGLPRLGSSSDLFRAQVDLLALVDVKPSNGIFTWNYRWGGEETIFERLDWFFVSCFWWWREGGPAFGTAMYFFVKKLQYVKYHLKRWNVSCFGNLKSKKKSALERLAMIACQIQDNGFSDSLGIAESHALRNVEEWELHEEMFWKQKVRVDWLQEAMSHEACQFYSNLFFENSSPTVEEENLILSCIPSLVTNTMNASLTPLISMSELENVVFGMNKGKSPGPDGFPVDVFQDFSDIINLDLLEVVRESLHHKKMLHALNSTFLILIPKKKGVDKLEFYRPIALCNVERAMFIKLDMAKDYDRVKWSFLQNILLAFGFSKEWVSWTMSCVTSLSFLVIVNGEPSVPFSASRGLRQGDPLSPYLFIIMAEGRGRLLKFRTSQGLIHGWQWGNGVPQISHLQFVDDTTLMGLARIREVESFRHVLDIYLAASSQKVNEHVNLPSSSLILLRPFRGGLLLFFGFREFDALSRQFVWSGSLSTTKWSLVKWETVCRPKNVGGLGLHSSILNGQVLDIKLYWCWCTCKNQLWACILTHKNLPEVNGFDVPRFPMEGQGSMIWNTLKLGA
ncbi:uncharacterized protein LOC131858791 [Cryptomeria japonica]|uniref:uncharacterized protein LOC131858791 n=1 Tax=Cryptomeria japonica TaxID=3369 RepID=UPI0027DA282C|nr:uncharacterized protein LOC131858791 [Cryptomeria japonica]